MKNKVRYFFTYNSYLIVRILFSIALVTISFVYLFNSKVPTYLNYIFTFICGIYIGYIFAYYSIKFLHRKG